jgi:hypothetical protein
MNRIIPPDDYAEACEAGVGNYIVRQLSGDLREYCEEFLEGLNALDAEAVAQFGGVLAELAEPQQDEILASVERGDIKTKWSIPTAKFFRQLVNLTMEGFYADPGNGGNRDQISWKMIRYQSKKMLNDE